MQFVSGTTCITHQVTINNPAHTSLMRNITNKLPEVCRAKLDASNICEIPKHVLARSSAEGKVLLWGFNCIN